MYYLVGAYILFLLILMIYFGHLKNQQNKMEEKLDLLKKSLAPEGEENGEM